MTVKIAFTGTGSIAKVHAQVAMSVADVELVAVVNHHSRSRSAFAERFGIPRQYESVDGLLSDGDVDALCVCTPNFLHAYETISALEAGVHVMVEKPMAMNAKEARDMVEASNSTGSLLMVAHCFRFDAEVAWLKEQVSSGLLGKIIRTKSYGVHVNWGPKGWFGDKKLAGGGALIDMGIHAIDTTRYLLGDPKPETVYAVIGTHYTEFDVDDTGVLMISWNQGTVSYIEFGWWQPHTDGQMCAAQMYGTEGFGQVNPAFIKTHNEESGVTEEMSPTFSVTRQHEHGRQKYTSQMAYFIQCVQEDRSPHPNGRVGLVNMQIIDAAYQSARTHEVVKM